MARQFGRLVQWNDERGFGFIESEGGQRHFAHISAFERGATRPQAGDRVSFSPVVGSDGRAQANSVRVLKAAAPARTVRTQAEPVRIRGIGWRLPLALILSGLLGAGLLFGSIPWELALVYAVMGVVSFVAYGSDKFFAQAGQWRIPEATLLGLDLCFGIIGGLLGQAMFRHKTRKGGFVMRAVAVSLVHLLWLPALTFGLVQDAILSGGG